MPAMSVMLVCLPQLLLAPGCFASASSAERLPWLCQSHPVASPPPLQVLFILLGHAETGDEAAAWQHTSAVMKGAE